MTKDVARIVVLWAVCVGACASGGPAESGDGGPVGDGGPRVDAGDAGTGDASSGDGGPVPAGCEGMRDGTPCDADGDGCTMDLCRGGVCGTAGVADCDDGLSCTTDTCRSTGASTFTCDRDVAAGCYIDGACVADGAANPAATCQSCDAEAPTEWTEITGVCDDGDECTEGDTCADGDCVGSPIVDDFEPNETEGAAHSLGSCSDGDSFPKGTVLATFYPVTDVDWYRYHDSDDAFSAIYPRAELRDIPAGLNFDLCVYVSCTAAEVSNCYEGSAASTYMGMPGCCARHADNADETVRINHTCDGGGLGNDDSADLFVRVENVGAAAHCGQSYRLRWGDD